MPQCVAVGPKADRVTVADTNDEPGAQPGGDRDGVLGGGTGSSPNGRKS